MNKYTVEIPVRIGSQRILKKNLRIIDGKPLVAYVIEACKKSRYVDEIYINSDSEILRKVAEEYGVKFYHRPTELGQDHVSQDEFNYDFLQKVQTENLVMVNPVTPLLLPEDIDSAIEYFEQQKLDSLIPVYDVQLHSFYNGKPLNFDIHQTLIMTQELDPLKIISWAVCIWNARKFTEHYDRSGHAIFVGKYELYAFHHVRSLKVSNEEDFQLASLYLSARNNPKKTTEYYE